MQQPSLDLVVQLIDELPPPLQSLHSPRSLLQQNLVAPAHPLLPTLQLPPLPAALLSETAVPFPLRLRACLPAWRALCAAVLSPSAASRVIEIIAHGFNPRVVPSTQPFFRPNSPTCRAHGHFVTDELNKFQALNIMSEVQQHEVAGVLAMSVQLQATGQRLVIDGTPLNHPEVTTQEKPFAVDDLTHLAQQIQPGDHATTFDVRRLFYHIPLHPEARKWYCVSWQGKFYEFKALPMGLQQSPSIAARVLAPATDALRRYWGIRLSQYVDDAVVLGSDLDAAHRAASTYTSLLARLGFMLHPTKCCTSPATTFTFLGFSINTAQPGEERRRHRQVLISMLPRKRAALLAATRQLRRTFAAPPAPSALPVIKLARYLGALRASLRAFLPVLAASRHLQQLLSTAVQQVGWRGTIYPTQDEARLALLELAFFKNTLAAELWTQRPLTKPTEAEVVMTTDASNEFGWGAFLSDPTSPDQALQVAQDQWPPATSPINPLPSFIEIIELVSQRTERVAHRALVATAAALDKLPFADPPVSASQRAHFHEEVAASHVTLLETTAVLYGILALSPALANKAVYVRTDNTTALAALLRPGRSRTAAIARVSLLVHFALLVMDAHLAAATHLPGVRNNVADEASRRWLSHREHLEWPLSCAGFNHLLCSLGAPAPTIDAFATSSNTKCRAFYSAFPDPRALAVDALAQSWSNKSLFINPPFAMAPLVVAKLFRDRPSSAVVLLPDWPGNTWHHLLSTSPWTVRSTVLHPQHIEWGPHRRLPEPLRNPKWVLRGWWLQFEPPGTTSPPSRQL